MHHYADDKDCEEQLRRLHEMFDQIHPRPSCIFRLAIEETEAWYLGEPEAIRRAFPLAQLSLARQWKPDARDGSWERFAKVIDARSEDKVSWAEAMGPLLSVEDGVNRSPSFQKFCRRVRQHAGEEVEVPASPRPKARRAR